MKYNILLKEGILFVTSALHLVLVQLNHILLLQIHVSIQDCKYSEASNLWVGQQVLQLS